MKNLFLQEDLNFTKKRLAKLNPQTKALWGKMEISQMLAHCNVAYEMTFEDKHPKPNSFKKFLLKTFVKNAVVGPKPYKKNSRTAPEFIITESKNFEEEKNRLLSYLDKTQKLGETYFNNKESHSFGKLSSKEWNMMFSKHLDHHLTQFGV
ncbi:DUF1569 domain-containing protein [Cellulophaga omnivescoria]|uniref:DUF1569 domain-containing protein n=2 Tax=Cellulophaga omnivescoria TaxID=1888890 RepID=UPI00098734F2|nr:DUF1569 domain-containing protein [Cellulophaga omnivescoria]WBU89137.1 DUF1569 domain-containing protein [Cellulophaga omnivescoria]WKB81132.1 DUF1569 domain-containing protein [Cellulophaga lytica]